MKDSPEPLDSNQNTQNEFGPPKSSEENYGWTKAALIKQTKRILGPLGRVWFRDGNYYVGLEKGQKKMALAFGPTPYVAFYRTFILPQKAKEEAAKARETELKKALEARRQQSDLRPSGESEPSRNA